MLTQNKLKELLTYESSTGLFCWNVDKGSRARAGSEAGSSHSTGYKFIRIDKKLYRCHRLAWLYTYGKWPQDQIDHLNGIRDDNRLSNLRQATNKENGCNRQANSNSKSGHKGVTYDPKNSKWRAQLSVGGKSINIGRFSSIDSAVAAHKDMSKRLQGEFSVA